MRSDWVVEFSQAAERDFELIFDHLMNAYLAFGDEPDVALERAIARIRRLRSEIGRIVETPKIGTVRADILPSARFLRRDDAAIWFVPIEERKVILVAAIFYGAQDHIRHMLVRLLAE